MWVSKHTLDAEILDAAGPKLKVVGAMSVGIDNINVEELKKRGIKLSNTPRVLDDSVAEVALMLALAAGKRMQEGRRDIETFVYKTLIIMQKIIALILAVIGNMLLIIY